MKSNVSWPWCVCGTCDMCGLSNLKSITSARCYMSVIWSMVTYLTIIYCRLKEHLDSTRTGQVAEPQMTKCTTLHLSHLYQLVMLSKNKLYDPVMHLCLTTPKVLHILVVFEGGRGAHWWEHQCFPVHHSLVHIRVPAMLHCYSRSLNNVSLVCFFLGNSPASEFYMPTFWNTLSVPSS